MDRFAPFATNHGYVQALEEIFQRKRTISMKAGAHLVKPAEHLLAVLVRECEVGDFDLDRPAPLVDSQHGLSQFFHPGSYQPALEFQVGLVARIHGDSQHTIDVA